METLNLPAFDVRTREQDGKQQVYDRLRGRYVRLTPEEWVRQHFVNFLTEYRGVPEGLISVEHHFRYQEMPRRADIVIFDRKGDAAVIVECKSPKVSISQETFQQIGRYNKVLGVEYLIVTNGRAHYCCEIDSERQSYRFLEDLPDFGTLLR